MNIIDIILNRPTEVSPVVDHKKDVTDDAEQSIIYTLLIGVVLGTIGLIGYPISIDKIDTSFIFIGILLAISTFIVGFFTGTLFGMPKRNSELNSDYSLNNSLVEISDWLTKIIVGLGLVNLKQIPIYLKNLGLYISESSNSNVQSFKVFSICVVIYFSVFGLYIGYNYMRLVLSQKYKEADENVLRKELVKKEIETEELKSTLQKGQLQKDKLIQAVNQQPDEEINLLDDTYINKMKENAFKKYKNGLLFYSDDPQKKQWGGNAKANNRELKADVQEFTTNIYRINIQVISTNPEEYPLEEGDVVLFALHQSFGEPPFRYVKVENGSAKLSLISYGSFTIGAYVDHGSTELELDLAELPNVSDYFKMN